MSIFLIFLAVLGEIMNTFCRVANAAMGMTVGTLRGSFVNHIVGTLFAALLLLAGISTGQLHFTGIPYYYFLGGCIGLLVVTANNFAVPFLGTMFTTLIIISTQLFASALIDHFALLGGEHLAFTLQRFVGVCFLIAGGVFVFARKQKSPL